MNDKLLYPYRLDTNPRYREVIKFSVALALAAISIPIVFSRNILIIPDDLALLSIFDWRVFLSWGLSIEAVISGTVFYYASAVWIRQAWGLETRMFGIKMKDDNTEAILDWSFWLCLGPTTLSFVLVLWFIVTYEYIP